MGAGDEEGDGGGKAKLECFDGSDPSVYRQWKRRAQLMIASLPSTINEKKYGPKLMGFISGEAESLLESLGIDKLCSDGGDKLIWQVLDEKYGPQQIDLLQEAMKRFFHELQVKNGESYRQFLVRFAQAERKLKEVNVELPNVVMGFMLLKKLRLDSTSESLVLTATKGKLDLKEITSAVKNVFPEGKGTQKEVLIAESGPVEEESDDLQDALDVFSADVQGRDGDDEEILECFENYVDIRKKITEQKKSRRYFPRPASEKPSAGWRLTGSIDGKIQQLKQRSRCHLCHRFGHWKRKCPLKKNREGSSSASSSATTSKAKEVHIIEDETDAEARRLWDVFMVERDLASEKEVLWEAQMANSVLNAGFADAHATGNRQRPGCVIRPPVVQSGNGEGLESEFFRSSEIFETFAEEEVLSAGKDQDVLLSFCGVPDTTCRRTLVGARTLLRIEEGLKGQGLSVQRAQVQNAFRFGNAGTLESTETVLLPASLGKKKLVIKAAVLP